MLKRTTKNAVSALLTAISTAALVLPAAAGADQSTVSCVQLAGGAATAANQCAQQNAAAVVQPSTAVGGKGGVAYAGDGGRAIAVGPGAHASSQGGSAQANGGNASSSNS